MANVSISIPSLLKNVVKQQSGVCLQASTVDDAMHQLMALYPELQVKIGTPDFNVKSFIQLTVNGENCSVKANLNRELYEGDVIGLIVPLAGG